MLAHTQVNPFDLQRVNVFCDALILTKKRHSNPDMFLIGVYPRMSDEMIDAVGGECI
jgi:hypothetical protein